MAGSFDFLHIKRRTAGSSNELSFDVLDQLSAEAGAKAKAAKAPRGPKASQGSYHGVAGSSTLSGQAEVERRKRARRNHRLRLQVLGVIVLVALVGVGVYAGVKFHEEQADFTTRIDALVERLSAVDETLVEVDAMMADPASAEWEDARAAVVKDAPALTTELARIRSDAGSLLSSSLDDQDDLALRQLAEAAHARTDMLSAAVKAFGDVDEAQRQVAAANSVWNAVLTADQLAREATSEANRATTQDSTRQSLEKTREALGGINGALGELRDLARTYGADFSEQEAYLEKKAEALGYAIATSEALLAGDRDAATSANDSYNEADAGAAKLAEALPPSIGGIIQASFDAVIAADQGVYQEARSRAIQTDSTIREYLSTR